MHPLSWLKNPVGATQAIEMIKLAPYPFSPSVLLNANYADGIDTSWIWDADFEQITDMDIPEINADGVRHSGNRSPFTSDWLSSW